MNKILQFFETLVPPFPVDDKTSPPKNLIGFILFYSKGLIKFFIAIAILTTIMAAGEAMFFSCMGMIVDWTQTTRAEDFFSTYGSKLFIMLLMAGVILPISALFHSLLLHQTLSGNYPMLIRWQVHRYILTQSLSFFTREYAGRVANKVMQTAMAVRTSVLKLIDVFVHMCVYIITMLIMLSSADLLLTLPLLIWLIFFIFAIYIFVPKIKELSSQQADSRSDMVGTIVDSYVNIATVKLFGGFGREEQYAKDKMKEYIGKEYKVMRILTLYDISVQFLNYSLLITITFLSIVLWVQGFVSAGSIAIAIAIAIRIINMSRWMMWEVGAIFENIGTVYDGMNTFALPREVEDKSDAIHISRLKGKVEFKNVSFAYDDGQSILDNLSFTIHPKQRVAIVGPSGQGKSTIINLLLRFYDVKQGQILVDDIDIRDITQDSLRDNFALVAQDTSLMHRSVGENICYGKDSCDYEEVMRATDLADAKGFIENLTDYRGNRGISSLVGERGAKLSGGQRQKIALARVLLKDAPILILDEATSALDSKSEQIIQEHLEQVMKDRTVIAIAHRLSTIAHMDKILVIDKGRIVQCGTHEQLLQETGLYQELWQKQSKKRSRLF